MSPDEAIEVVGMEMGSMTAKLARLVEVLPSIDVEACKRIGPRCACGADLTVWHGRHSDKVFIYHPKLSPKDCPRAGFRSEGATDPKEAMRIYIETAPDISCFDATHDPEPEDEDFSADFT